MDDFFKELEAKINQGDKFEIDSFMDFMTNFYILNPSPVVVLFGTWDDGGRKLYRCHDCGGLVLVQKSEYHGQENDDYYTDYFPVDSVQEAEQLNELYGGWAIEKEWNGKKVFVSNGHVTPNYC